MKAGWAVFCLGRTAPYVRIVGDTNPVYSLRKVDQVRFQPWNGHWQPPGPFGSDLPDHEEVSEFVVVYLYKNEYGFSFGIYFST